MTQHQKAQRLAKGYYDLLIITGFDASYAWKSAMTTFKQEMLK